MKEATENLEKEDVTPSKEATPLYEETKKKKKHRRKIYEITKENDIKYRGPLSYRHLRILGWLYSAAGSLTSAG